MYRRTLSLLFDIIRSGFNTCTNDSMNKLYETGVDVVDNLMLKDHQT